MVLQDPQMREVGYGCHTFQPFKCRPVTLLAYSLSLHTNWDTHMHRKKQRSGEGGYPKGMVNWHNSIKISHYNCILTVTTSHPFLNISQVAHCSRQCQRAKKPSHAYHQLPGMGAAFHLRWLINAPYTDP